MSARGCAGKTRRLVGEILRRAEPEGTEARNTQHYSGTAEADMGMDQSLGPQGLEIGRRDFGKPAQHRQGSMQRRQIGAAGVPCLGRGGFCRLRHCPVPVAPKTEPRHPACQE